MTPSPPLAAIVGDVLWCLGLGLALGAVRDVAGMALGNGRLRCFLWDLLCFAGAAVLVCGFAAAVSASGQVRWYMAAGMALGALAWVWAVSGAVHRLAHFALRGLTLPLRVFSCRVAAPLRAAREKRKKSRLEKNIAHKPAKKGKNPKKELQKPKRVLYN